MPHTFRPSLFFAGFFVLLCANDLAAQIPQAKPGDWPWWRGPNRNGLAEGGQTQVPTQWSRTKNVIWAAKVPGRGHGSPTLVGQRLFLASHIADSQCVLALDRGTGKPLWKQVVNRGGLTSRINKKNTHATATVACDGQRVFVAFYNHGEIQVTGLSVAGKPLWKRRCGVFAAKKYPNGYGVSPILYGDLVIVAADNETSGYIVALHKQTGVIVWKTPRPSGSNYATPTIAHVADRDQLLIPGCLRVASFDPGKGTPLWEIPSTPLQATAGILWDKDLVFANGGFPAPEIVCVKADGSKKVIWRKQIKVFEQSMLLYQGHIYAITDSGIAYCWHARSGQTRWRKRLRGPVSASPALVNGLIYLTNEAGTTWVYRATPKGYQQVAENKLGDEVFASVSISRNRLYYRVSHVSNDKRHEVLYCIGK